MSGVIAIDATGLDGVITVDVTVPGPQGPQGIQGPVGPSGPQGPVGPQGPIGSGVWVSDTPPALALVDDLWWDSTGTGLYVRYNDGNSTQWVVAENQNTVPEAPRDGATYGRMNGTWAGVLPASSGPFLPLSGGGTVTGPVMATSVGFCDSNANKVPATLAFPTIAALKAFNPSSISGQAIAHVANYSTVWDGGGGTFDWDSGCTNAQDNYAIVRSNYITGTAAGAWRRRMDPGNVTFEQAGARGDYDFASDTGTSDFTAIQAVLNYWSFVSGSLPAPVHAGVTVTLRPGRQYLVTGTINISRFMRILGSGWTYGVFDRNNPRYLSSGSGFVVDVAAGGAITLAQSNFVHGIQILRRGLLYNPTGAQVIAAYTTWASTASVGLAATGLGCIIDNVIIVGFNTGITSLTAGQSARVLDCVIDCVNGVEISGAGDRNWLVRVKCVPKYAGAVAAGDPDLTAARHHTGIGFNIHDRGDTLILDQCESENWSTGIRLSNVWGVRVNQPAIECTSTAGDTGILLQNVCSYVSIISPYINNAQFCIDCQATDQAHSTGSSSQTTSNVIIEGGDTNGNATWTATGAHIRIGGSAAGQISGMMANNQFMPWLVVQAPTGTFPGNWLVRNISINEANNTWTQYVTIDASMIANVRLSGIMRANSNTWIAPPAPDYVPLAGGVTITGTLGFNGAAPIAKPTVSGAWAGNAAGKALSTALAAYGLVLDSTTA